MNTVDLCSADPENGNLLRELESRLQAMEERLQELEEDVETMADTLSLIPVEPVEID